MLKVLAQLDSFEALLYGLWMVFFQGLHMIFLCGCLCPNFLLQGHQLY
jgi:hypothetical protein